MMNCSEVRAVLPLLIYGDAGPHERAELVDHLAHCPACRREQRALEDVRRMLDTAAVPPIRMDLEQLQRSVADREMRRVRRWRRGAFALGAVAALLLLALGLRLEVRLQSGQMVVRWGEPSPPAPPAAAVSGGTGVPPVQTHDRRDAGPTVPSETVAELRVLRELIHALKQDLDGRDRQLDQRLDRLQRHVQILQAEADQRWNTTEQDVAALYLLSRKGDKP